MNRRQFLYSATASTLALTALRAQEERPLRVAIIGHGGDFGHGLHTMWLGLPGVEIAGVADPVADKLPATLEKLKITAGFADYHELLDRTKPDLVAIGPRQIADHHAMALAAIESGAKGLYLEKPFCRTLAEADEIIAASDRRGVKLAIAHRNRYQPVLPVIARLLQEGRLGRLLELRGRGKEDARGGCQDLWVLGSHVLNTALVFTGPPLACNATLYQDRRPATPADLRPGSEDVGPIAGNALHARFETESGLPLFFDSVQNAGLPAAGFGLQLIGTAGLIDLRMDTTPFAHFVPGNPFQPTAAPRPWQPISTAGIGEPEPIADLGKSVMSHRLSALDLIAAIRENRAPLCSATDGRLIVEMIAAVFTSHLHGGARVELPLRERDNPLTRWS